MGSREEDYVMSPVETPDPSPVRWILLNRWSPEHRRINCVYYDWCLTEVIRKNWIGWSCCDCLVREEWNPEEGGEEPHGDSSNNL